MPTEYNYVDKDWSGYLTVALNDPDDSDVFIGVHTQTDTNDYNAWTVLTVGQVHDLIRDLQELTGAR